MARKLSFMDCGGNFLAGLGLITASAIASNCYKKPANYKPYDPKHYEMLRDYHTAYPKGKDLTAEFLHDLRKNYKNKERHKEYYDELLEATKEAAKSVKSIANCSGTLVKAEMSLDTRSEKLENIVFNATKTLPVRIYEDDIKWYRTDKGEIHTYYKEIKVGIDSIMVFNEETGLYDITPREYYKSKFDQIINIYKKAFMSGIQIEKGLNTYLSGLSNLDEWLYNAHNIRKYRKKGLL